MKKILTSILGCLSLCSFSATPVLLLDYRNLSCYAESDEERRGGNPWWPQPEIHPRSFNMALGQSADAQGGPGSSRASSSTSQNSTMDPGLHQGFLAVATDAHATVSTVQWPYHAFATAESIYGVRFELLTWHDYGASASAIGNTSISLTEVGANSLFSVSRFETFSFTGQLGPGIYDFFFAVNADAVALGSLTSGSSDYEAASGNFQFWLTESNNVPEPTTTLLFLAGLAGLWRWRVRMQEGSASC